MSSQLFSCRRRHRAPAVSVVMLLAAGCGASPDNQPKDDGKVAVQSPTVAPSAEKAENHVDAGKQALAAAQPEKAVNEFTAALRELRTNQERVLAGSPEADVYYQRGLAFLAMGFPDTAAEDFTEVIQRRPDDGSAFAGRGESYAQLGDWYKAIRDLTDAIRFDPDNAGAYRSRGSAYMRRGQFDRSVADFEHAIELDPLLVESLKPQLAAAYYRWSRQLAEASDETESAAKLAKARELNPALGEIAEMRAQLSNAPAILEAQTVAKPVLAEAQERINKGREHFAEREFDEALIEFTEAIALNRDFAEAYLARGETLLELGFPDTAIKDFQQAVELNEQSARARQLEARAFAKLGNNYRAVGAATEALHIDPTDAASYAIRGAAYVAIHDWDRGITDLDEAIRRQPHLESELKPIIEAARRGREEDARRQNQLAEPPDERPTT